LRVLAALLVAACLPALVAGQTAKPKSGEAARRAISGRVVFDNGRPVPNAEVSAVPVGDTAGNRRTAATDAAGEFIIPDLPPRAYRVSAWAPAYVMPDAGPGASPTYYRPGSTLTLTLVKGGVITGTVTSATGEPLVGRVVRAVSSGARPGGPFDARGGETATDDRGIYRMYSLTPGTYLVYVANSHGQPQGFPFEDDVPTYYPSATRDAAAEVTVNAGDEVTGIDIRDRGAKGRAVSGAVSAGPIGAGQFGTVVSLARPGGATLDTTFTFGAGSTPFAFYGVPDGEYDVVAEAWDPKEGRYTSEPKRVAVRGADVTGVNLTLLALGSIEGRLVVDPAPGEGRPAGCEKAQPGAATEAVVRARRDLRDAAPAQASDWETPETAPDEKGAFTIKGLRAGVHRIDARLPSDDWYVRAVTTPATGAAKAQVDAARDGLRLTAGQKLDGVTVAVAIGAAGVSGKVAAPEGQRLPAPLAIHLVPADPADADDVLRYPEAVVAQDGSFELKHVPPGKYRLLARAAPSDESRPPRPAAWDRRERAKLRAEAEAAGQEVELAPCQRAAGLVVRHAPAGAR
jgi:hypothetical protein